MSGPRTELAQKNCVPCRGGVPPLDKAEVERLQSQLNVAWRVVDGHHLSRLWLFADFAEALGFTNRLGELAESQGHHPDIHLAWGRVEIELFTHKINGLSESDFVLAAKIDRL